MFSFLLHQAVSVCQCLILIIFFWTRMMMMVCTFGRMKEAKLKRILFFNLIAKWWFRCVGYLLTPTRVHGHARYLTLPNIDFYQYWLKKYIYPHIFCTIITPTHLLGEKIYIFYSCAYQMWQFFWRGYSLTWIFFCGHLKSTSLEPDW